MNQLPPYPSPKIIKSKESQAWLDGYAFLEAARHEADSLVEAAKREREAHRRDGFDAGRAEGEIEISKLLSDTTAKVDAYLASLEEDIVDLVLLIVERVIGPMGDVSLSTAMARQALRHLRHERDLTINVPPGACEAIENLIHSEFTDAASYPIKVVADPNLERGRCVLTTPAAVVDTTLNAQLSTIRAALMAAQEAVTPSPEWG
ncbi:HrpE/YscL family type III secretion apparatus protein [Ensifer sp. ENS02]|uniref:FliH/SctL family protein n=1 Tax=Ensifer sp. ENS02 TaxID=2769290 RepID=UPI00177F64D3|nr:FliH/SctL family protein [Ensifer sp. ENS02]MBD9524737.1 HrpE/YscL family type III secretion apparatus protein [Ensifer sp. ENS02]